MAPTRMGVDGLESHVCRSKPFKFLNPIRLKMYTAHITTEYETVSRPGSTTVQSQSITYAEQVAICRKRCQKRNFYYRSLTGSNNGAIFDDLYDLLDHYFHLLQTC